MTRTLSVLFIALFLISCGGGGNSNTEAYSSSCRSLVEDACILYSSSVKELAEAHKEECGNDTDFEVVSSCPAASCIAQCNSNVEADGFALKSAVYFYEGYADPELSCATESGAVFSNSCDL